MPTIWDVVQRRLTHDGSAAFLRIRSITLRRVIPASKRQMPSLSRRSGKRPSRAARKETLHHADGDVLLICDLLPLTDQRLAREPNNLWKAAIPDNEDIREMDARRG